MVWAFIQRENDFKLLGFKSNNSEVEMDHFKYCLSAKKLFDRYPQNGWIHVAQYKTSLWKKKILQPSLTWPSAASEDVGVFPGSAGAVAGTDAPSFHLRQLRAWLLQPYPLTGNLVVTDY